MLKVLLKKQFFEFFRSFFVDQKKNTARTKAASVVWIVFYIFLMVGMLGGMFTALSFTMCSSLAAVDLAWLYFSIMGLLSLLLGVFASVFTTYSSLYLAKDNDLLLSMPIPVRLIMIARLLGVYLMGLMYSILVILPAIIVYWVQVSFSPLSVLGCLALLVVISVFVLVLSCALGWVVAKISIKLKNKSIVTVLLSLLFIGLYYFFYFKAQSLIQALLLNAVEYGEKIKGAAYGVYLFGRIGEGSIPSVLLFLAVGVLLFVLTWYVLSHSFLKITSSTGNVATVKYKEKAVKGRSVRAALFHKEVAKFLSSPNYMLNCGLGTLLLPIGGVALLLKGEMLQTILGDVFAAHPESIVALFCAAVCMLASMNDTAAPSVSLEGKSLWLLKSLPLNAWDVLSAKIMLQLMLTLPPMAVCLACGAIAFRAQGAIVLLLAALTALSFGVLGAVFGLYLGVNKPIFEWTNDTVPIKQSMSVTIALFSGWGYAILLAGGYLLFGHLIGITAYLGIFLVLTAAACALLVRWLKTTGTAMFAAM